LATLDGICVITPECDATLTKVGTHGYRGFVVRDIDMHVDFFAFVDTDVA
jgi:hypothetical protein